MKEFSLSPKFLELAEFDHPKTEFFFFFFAPFFDEQFLEICLLRQGASASLTWKLKRQLRLGCIMCSICENPSSHITHSGIQIRPVIFLKLVGGEPLRRTVPFFFPARALFLARPKTPEPNIILNKNLPKTNPTSLARS